MNLPEIELAVKNQRAYFNSSATQSYAFRITQLNNLKTALIKFEGKFSASLKKDLGKPEFEAYITETGFALHDISTSLKNLKKWMKPKRIKTPILIQPSSSKILSTPLGVNLIISPFNYPVGLTFLPLIAAISAGNTCVIKTSELTPNTSKVIEQLINETFNANYVIYIPGEVPETTLLLQQKFDHIFFTGSPRVGSIVMTAAAKFLTPITLELGGKSPCIVHHDANIDIAVKRIVYGKFMNAGQTCVAPDYLLVHKSIKNVFLKKLKARVLEMYGKDASQSPAFGRIVNEHNFLRIKNLIDPEKTLVGGGYDKESRYIAPTVLKDVQLEDKVMQEEIFGPVLPVLDYETFEQIHTIIGQLPQHPLACYIFSENQHVQEELTTKIQFGGGCINHCIQHLVNTNLPFGGVGESGMGSYHGINGFMCFSHQKSILKAATWLDLNLIYPPYKNKLKRIKMLLK